MNDTQQKTMTIAGTEITVTPVRVGRLPDFLSAVEPIAREIADGDIPAALMRHADAVIDAVRVGANVPRDWLNERDAAELVDLAVAVLEVNADFFAQQVLPRITVAAERLALIGAGGTNGSPGSAAPASTIAA